VCQALRAARTCWPRAADPDDRQTQLDKGELLTYLALVDEGAGRRAGAVEALREMLQLFPDRTSLALRLADLKAG
jgi:hypothetical protein